MFDHIYVDPHPQLAQERAEFAAYLAGFEDATGDSSGPAQGGGN